MNQTSEDKFSQFKQSLESRLGRELSDADLVEIKQSLYHLGKALYLFHLQKKGGGK